MELDKRALPLTRGQLANVPLWGARAGLKMARWSPCDAVHPWFFEAVSRALGSRVGPSLLPPLVLGRARGLDSGSFLRPHGRPT
jgi:hypothetical protein